MSTETNQPEKTKEGEKPPSSSLIRLDNYVALMEDDTIRHGIPLPQMGSDKIRRAEIMSVSLPGDKTPPAHSIGILMLYGFRDGLEELGRQRKLLTEDKAERLFHPVSIDFDVGVICTRVVSLDLVPAQRFLNIKRTTAEVQHLIRDRFEAFIRADGGEPEDVKRIQQIARRPDLFGRLVQEPPFDKVEILVFPVQTEGGVKATDASLRQFALVTRKAKYVEVIQNSRSRLEAVLPEWMQKYVPPQK